MKLNDKHLAGFAVGSAPIDKEGYLMKRGEMNKAFQTRWFLLKGNLLFYFEKKGDKEPIGVVILEGCTVELSENSDLYTFELVFQGSGTRTYVLAAKSQEEMEDWMKAIACASYDYMKLMVAELQRQMEELSVDKTPATAAGATAAAVPVVPPRPSKKASMAQGVKSQELLVDLTVPDTGQKPPQAARMNPFNSGQPPEELDPFGATPFVPDHYSQSVQQPRTFAKMHQDFGQYIQQKMRGLVKTELLLDI